VKRKKEKRGQESDFGTLRACLKGWPVGSAALPGAHFRVCPPFPLPRPGLLEAKLPPPPGSSHTPFSTLARGLGSTRRWAGNLGRFARAAGGLGGLAREKGKFLPPFSVAKSMAYKGDRRRLLSSFPFPLAPVRHQLGFRGGVRRAVVRDRRASSPFSRCGSAPTRRRAGVDLAGTPGGAVLLPRCWR
jgi:hypothetical protein